MSKWRKVSPDQIKAGDLVKVRHVSDAYEETTSAVATNVTDLEIGVGPYSLYKDKGTWYIAKPKKAKPLTRPDEPPVGTFFRVDRRPLTTYRRVDNALNGYICVTTPSSWLNWNNIVDLGDTIKMLELREVGK